MVRGRSGRIAVLVAAFAALVLVAGPAAAQEGIDLELNKIETKGDLCRITFVLNNRTDAAFSEFELNFAFFDSGGTVMRDLLVDFGQLRSKKTVVRYFDVPELSCPALAKVLLNHVAACAPAVPGGDCLDLIKPSARGDVDFYK